MEDGKTVHFAIPTNSHGENNTEDTAFTKQFWSDFSNAIRSYVLETGAHFREEQALGSRVFTFKLPHETKDSFYPEKPMEKLGRYLTNFIKEDKFDNSLRGNFSRQALGVLGTKLKLYNLGENYDG